MKKKINILILVLVILILVAVVVIFWKRKNTINDANQSVQNQIIKEQIQTEQVQENESDIVARNLDVSKWKIYTNKEYGIEFKYPEELFDLKIRNNDYSGSVESIDIKNFSIWIFQKGFSPDDIGHRIIIDINSPKTVQEYYVEKYGKCSVVPVGNKNGKICEYDNSSKYKDEEFKKSIERFSSLINNGICQGSFTIFVDEFKIDYFGDFRNGIFVDCNNDFGIAKIYQTIHKSIHFSE